MASFGTGTSVAGGGGSWDTLIAPVDLDALLSYNLQLQDHIDAGYRFFQLNVTGNTTADTTVTLQGEQIKGQVKDFGNIPFSLDTAAPATTFADTSSVIVGTTHSTLADQFVLTADIMIAYDANIDRYGGYMEGLWKSAVGRNTKEFKANIATSSSSSIYFVIFVSAASTRYFQAGSTLKLVGRK